MNLIAPPLKIWLIVFSFGILSALSFYKYSGSQYGILNKKGREIEKLIINNCASNKDTISVIIVGSSLTRNAFGDAFDMSNELTKKFGRPAKSLKINIYALTLNQAVDLSIFKSINKYPPDILFVESRLFIHFTQNPKKIPFHLINSVNFLSSEIKKRIVNSKTESSINSLINPKFLSNYFNTKADHNLLKLILKRERRVNSFEENKAVNTTFDLLKRKKKKVVLLGFPNCVEVNKVFDKTEIEFLKLAQKYQKTYNVTYWSTDSATFATDLFTDGMHLNYQGAKVYQNWFKKKIITDL
jgi:hypothetical protein